MKISPESSAALSRLFIAGREATTSGAGRPLSRAMVARKARRMLRERADSEHATPEERDLWSQAPINSRQLSTLEHCPTAPMQRPQRRAYLLAFALALGVDLAQVNRFAGGI